MNIAKSATIGVLLAGMIMAATASNAAGEAKPPNAYTHPIPSPPAEAIFAANYFDVTAYPVGGKGNIAPLAAPAGMASPYGLARDSGGRLYVTNYATNTILVYPANANGATAPLAVIGGANTGLAQPSAIAVDSSGKIYVVNSVTSGAQASISIYAPLGNETGNADDPPIATITGDKTQLKSPAGIAVDSSGKIYVANAGKMKCTCRHGCRVLVPGSVTVYPAGGSGNLAPIAEIEGAATKLASPAGIALDSSGNIYVANYGAPPDFSPGITVYAAGSNGDAAPVAAISGVNTALNVLLGGIAIDSSGNIFVAGYVNVAGTNTEGVNVYAAGSSGDVAPIASINGSDTGLAYPTALVLDSSGNLFVSNAFGGPNGTGSITVYPPGSNGDAVPSASISSEIGFARSSGIAMDSDGDIFVLSPGTYPAYAGSVAVYPPGSYANTAPIATIKGGDTELSDPVALAADADGDLYVVNQGIEPSYVASVTVYSAGADGNAAPIAAISGPDTMLTSPSAIAADSIGTIYVVNQGSVKCGKHSCHRVIPASVTIYAPGATGDAKPIATISGPKSGLGDPSAIAVDSAGKILVANDYFSQSGSHPWVHAIPSLPPAPIGRMTPAIAANYEGGCSSFGQAVAVLLPGSGSVTVYSPGSKGDVAPIATIGGPDTGLGAPFGIALDSDRNIYVLSEGGGMPTAADSMFSAPDGTFFNFGNYFYSVPRILEYAAGSDGDAAPIAAIGGRNTLLDPSGIAIGPSSTP